VASRKDSGETRPRGLRLCRTHPQLRLAHRQDHDCPLSPNVPRRRR
jgi:hypothetical protein